MVITNFLRPALNRVLYAELAGTKFAGFEEDLVLAFLENVKTCKNAYISYGGSESLVSSSLSHHWKPIYLMV